MTQETGLGHDAEKATGNMRLLVRVLLKANYAARANDPYVPGEVYVYASVCTQAEAKLS